MSVFTKEELEAAKKAIASSIRKIEKARQTLLQKSPPPKAQLTLSERNLSALNIALALICEQLDKQ